MTYCIYAAKGTALTKIGFSGNIKQRFQNLKIMYGSKRILHTEPASNELLARSAEALCHKILNEYHIEGEFFKVTKKVAVAAMRVAVKTVSIINDIYVYDKPRFIVKESLCYLSKRVYGPPTYQMALTAANYHASGVSVSYAVERRDRDMVHHKKTFAYSIMKMNKEWKTQGYGLSAQYHGARLIRATQIQALIDDNNDIDELAAKYGVSAATIRRIAKSDVRGADLSGACLGEKP